MTIKSKKLKADLVKVVDYLWHDEQKHYMGCPSKYHIYVTIRRIAKAVRYKPSFFGYKVV